MTNTGMMRQGFINDEPPAILERLNRLYGIQTLQELDQILLCLHDLNNNNQPVELMLWTTEEFQIFLIAHPNGDREIRNLNIISYSIIKLSKCGGLYTKAIGHDQCNTK